MKNIFRNFDIKKIQLSRLEKYADILFSLSFVAVIVFLGLIFYNQFLPIYNFDAFGPSKNNPGGNVPGAIILKEEKLNNIIKNLDERKTKTENYTVDSSIHDPFAGSR